MEVAVQAFVAFLAGAILVETLTKIVGDMFAKVDKGILAIVIGIVVAFYGRFNILSIVGLEYGWSGNVSLEYVGLAIGIVFSGLILSRGANGVHEFISRLQSSRQLTEAKKEVAVVEAEAFTTETDINTDLR